VILRSAGQCGPARIWAIPLDQPEAEVSEAWATLSPAERMRAEGISVPVIQRQWVVSRGGLRTILGAARSIPATAVEILGDRWQKPWTRLGPSFSLSHSAELALCAVADREVGIDVEWVRPLQGAARIAERWLGPELEAFLQAGDPSVEERFFRAWTRREAYLKALGTGLEGADGHQSVDAERWEIHELRPATGYVAAVVVRRDTAGQGVIR
jgi:4'-phosphopantetheinyl transferase